MCQICGQPDNIRCNCQVSQPYCDQCGNDNACEEKMDAQCVFYHLNCTDPAGLPNLGISCNTDLETILEALDDLVGNSLNIPFAGTETTTIRWVANGPAGHKPYAHIKISQNPGNKLEIREDGLYISCCDCSPVFFSENSQLPPATDNFPYNHVINLAGTSPFVLSDVVKPAWLNISIVNSTIVLSGTPENTGSVDGIAISFKVSNCVDDEQSFNGTINILSEGNHALKITLSNNSVLACTSGATLVYYSGVFTPSVTILYTNNLMTIPVSGFNYILWSLDNNIYNINNTTGLVGTLIGPCS